MTDKLTRITITGHRPGTEFEGKSGTAIRFAEDISPETWLLNLREALDALYIHEARKLQDLGLSATSYRTSLRAADIAEGEEFNG